MFYNTELPRGARRKLIFGKPFVLQVRSSLAAPEENPFQKTCVGKQLLKWAAAGLRRFLLHTNDFC